MKSDIFLLVRQTQLMKYRALSAGTKIRKEQALFVEPHYNWHLLQRQALKFDQ